MLRDRPGVLLQRDESPARPSRAPEGCIVLALAAILALKVGLGLWLRVRGFEAISDDDYARLAIAQQFAASPAWDPSQTSWLPLPFWVQGGAYRIFGIQPWVPQTLALILSAASSALVFVAARALDLSPRASLVAALGCSILPHALWLGTANVPGGYSAALILLGLACAGRSEPRWSWLGAAALLLATLSRYEAWPVAVAFAAFALRHAWRGTSRRERLSALGAGLLAVLGPVAWVLHGMANHDDAAFFVKRVVAYREALGGEGAGIADGWLRYPLILLRAEPELTAAVLVALLVGGVRAGGVQRLAVASDAARRFAAAAVLGAAMFVVLIWGDWRGGSATHHPERPLLALWLLAVVWLAWLVVDRGWFRSVGFAALLAVSLLVAHVLRPWVTHRDAFADRGAELAIGRAAAELVPLGERLGVHTGDYGYFAVQVGFGRPSDAVPVAPPDPRLAQRESPFRSAGRLSETVRDRDIDWLVVSEEQLGVALALGAQRRQVAGLSLVSLQSRR